MCNNNGEKEKGEKSKTSNEKSCKRKLFKYARLLVGFAFNSFSFWASSLSLILPLPLSEFSLSRFGQLQQNKLQIKN